MLSSIRRRITYANVAVTLALVFAMSGGAYAAGHYLITSTKQFSPKVLKALKGHAGARGANGANGASGAQGAQGAQGPQGAQGAGGPGGLEGKPGISVTSKQLTNKEAACNKEGGSEFTAGTTKTTACNGSPWTVNGLPKGATEKGHWSLADFVKANQGSFVPTTISFVIPLASEPEESNVHFIGPEEGQGEPKQNLPEGCSGNAGEPQAASGNVCVFTRAFQNMKKFGVGADRAGVTILLAPGAEGVAAEEGSATAFGTWAVTG